MEGAILGDFEPDQLKTDPKKNEKRIESFTLSVAQGAAGLADAVGGGTDRRGSAELQPGTEQRARQPADSAGAGGTGRRRWRRNLAWNARFSTKAECGSSAWDRCWGWRRAATIRRR